jgi:hypothetical protein
MLVLLVEFSDSDYWLTFDEFRKKEKQLHYRSAWQQNVIAVREPDTLTAKLQYVITFTKTLLRNFSISSIGYMTSNDQNGYSQTL